MSSLIRQIEDAYPGLTPSLRKVADYLLAHPVEAQYLSISDLADTCGVGKATVSRLCDNLGYEGYGSLKLALARLGTVPTYDAIRQSAEPIPEAVKLANAKAAARQMRDVNVAAMDETLALMDWAALVRCARLLQRARDVYCLGHGGCDTVAADAWSHFITLSPKFRHVTDSHCQIMTASLMDEGAVVLFLSYLGVTKDAIDVLENAKAAGAHIIVVTRYPNSPVAEYAEEVLVCGGRETPLEGGSISAKVSLLFVIGLLSEEYCRVDQPRAQMNADRTSDALATRML